MPQKKSLSLFQRLKQALSSKSSEQPDRLASDDQANALSDHTATEDTSTDHTPVGDAHREPDSRSSATYIRYSVRPKGAPITARDIEHALEQLDYKFTYHAPTTAANMPDDEPPAPVHHFTMQISDETHTWGCMVRYFETQQLLAVYSILPFRVPDSHRASLVVSLTQLNYDLVIGNLELDLSDGELRFKTSLDIEVTGLDDGVIGYLLNSNFAMTSRLYDTLEQLTQLDTPAATLSDAFEQMLYLEQATTFYLASDSRQ